MVYILSAFVSSVLLGSFAAGAGRTNRSASVKFPQNRTRTLLRGHNLRALSRLATVDAYSCNIPINFLVVSHGRSTFVGRKHSKNLEINFLLEVLLQGTSEYRLRMKYEKAGNTFDMV